MTRWGLLVVMGWGLSGASVEAQIRSAAVDPPTPAAAEMVILSPESIDALGRAIADAIRLPVVPVTPPAGAPVLPAATPQQAVPSIPVTLPPGAATAEQFWIVLAGILAQVIYSIYKSVRAASANARNVATLAEIKAK